MDGYTPISRAAAADKLLDLEMPLVDARASARCLAIVVDEVLQSLHPGLTAPKGTTALLLDEETVEALNHVVTAVLTNTRKAAEVFYTSAKDR